MGEFEKGTQGAFWLKVIGRSAARAHRHRPHHPHPPVLRPDWPQPDEGVGDHRVIVDGDPR